MSRLLYLASALLLLAALPSARGEESDDLIWYVQLSDLHISKYHPERASDLKTKVAPALALIQPSAVLITGDLTESRTSTRYPTRQDDWEWYEYNTVIASLAKASDVPFEAFVDLRGNHDTFGVGLRGGLSDLYPKYGAIGGRHNRTAGAVQRVFAVPIQEGNGPKHFLVGIDAAQEIGLRGPSNFFGMPSDALLDSLDSTLEHIGKAASMVVTFGHFPLSFMARSDSGRRLEDVLKKHKVDAYLCGHLHARFGGLLHKFHQRHVAYGDQAAAARKESGGPALVDGMAADEEIEEETTDGSQRELQEDAVRATLSGSGRLSDGFWEWEMGDWKESRFMRLVALRKGQVSFTDVQFSTQEAENVGQEAAAEYRRSIGLGQLVENQGTSHDSQFYDQHSALILVLSPSNGHYQPSVGVSAIEALVFSRHEPLDVSAQIWDRGSGFASKGSIKEEVRLRKEKAALYSSPWNAQPYLGGQPGRFWIQIVVRDSNGQKMASRQQPFIVADEGRTERRLPLFMQSIPSYLLISVRWDELYGPALMGVYLVLLGLLLLLPRLWGAYLQSHRRYEEWTLRVVRPWRTVWNPLLTVSRLADALSWALCRSASRTPLFLSQVVYLSYLALGPWFWGQALDDSSLPLSSFYLRHWNVALSKNGASVFAPMPCTLIVALPFYLLVLFPWMLWIAAYAAYRDLCQWPYLKPSLSMPPKKDVEHQMARSTSETELASRSDSASNLARKAMVPRRRNPSKAALRRDDDDDDQMMVQSSDVRTGPRAFAKLGWALKGGGLMLAGWTLLHSTFAMKAYGSTVLLSPYLVGLLCVVLFALFSPR